MANNYTDMTGLLNLKQVTPVIKALFGSLELDETLGGEGHAYIADMAESTDGSWVPVLEALRPLVTSLGLTLPTGSEDDMQTNLQVLATHFGADGDEALGKLIASVTDEAADIEDRFVIAKAFDDGHGLTGYKTEMCWHCDKPRLFEFGGAGEFTGSHFSVFESSYQAVELGEAMEQTLAVGDSAKAADILGKKLDRILKGVYDDSARAAVRASLSSLLAIPAPV